MSGDPQWTPGETTPTYDLIPRLTCVHFTVATCGPGRLVPRLHALPSVFYTLEKPARVFPKCKKCWAVEPGTEAMGLVQFSCTQGRRVHFCTDKDNCSFRQPREAHFLYFMCDVVC